MAENNEDRNPEDLSDEPSQLRMEEYRQKGQVAQSREMVGILVLAACGATLFAMAPSLFESMKALLKEVFEKDLILKPGADFQAKSGESLLRALKSMVSIGLPICAVGFVLGIIGHVAQIGFLFTFEPLSPKLDKLDPIQGFQRLFSMRNLIESGRLVIKGIVLCFVGYGVIKTATLQSPALIFQNPAAIFDVLGDAGKSLFWSLVMCLVVFAGVDYFFQRKEFMKNVRLTKQEAKQESKEQEGDPMVKGRIRAIQREMTRRRMMSAIKKADVIITNPTHIAIALQYDRDKMVAPRVVAKGADLLAQKIKEVAKQNNIPMVENVPLARAIFKSVKIGQMIPRNLFQAVAEVLAYVYRLKNRKF